MISQINKRFFSFQRFFNYEAFSLLELVIMIAVLVIISVFAITMMTNIARRSIVVSEQALVRSLSKAAVAYNTANDSWYGNSSTQDIFAQFLDNPPP